MGRVNALPIKEQSENILKYLVEATPEEVKGGLVWYSDVRQWCTELADEYDYTLKQAAAVVAVLSPNTPWEHNLRYAKAALMHAREYEPKDSFGLKEDGVRTFTNAIATVYLILRFKAYGYITGQKVSAFWDNIWNKESVAVTHDIWSNRVVWNDITKRGGTITQAQYPLAVRSYHRALEIAKKENRVKDLEYAYQLQAIVWVVARRLKDEGVESL